MLCSLEKITSSQSSLTSASAFSALTLLAERQEGHPACKNGTRHRASTSMYSLTFCIRVMLPERHQWKPAVQAATVMLRTPPPLLTASHRPESIMVYLSGAGLPRLFWKKGR